MYNFSKELFYRFKNDTFGGIRERICFVHTHKCGGTSIKSAIRAHYIKLDMRRDRDLVSIDAAASAYASRSTDSNSDKELYRFREKLLMYYLGSRNTRFLSGHFLFSENAYERFKNRFAFIIVLRDPIERWISHYFFNRYKKGNYGKISQDINECINSEFGRLNGIEYINFLRGSTNNDLNIEESIDRAKCNLKHFEVIGFLEYKKDFLKKFKNRFGVNLNLPQKNKNPKSDDFKNTFLNNKLKTKIADLCQPDLDLYDFALSKYLKTK